MIKAILFDFDGVLTTQKTGSTQIVAYLAEKTNITEELLLKEYYKYNKDLLYGRTTHKEIWETFCKNVGSEIDYRLLTEAFRNVSFDENMINLAKELKKSYKIGLITDNKCDRIEEILDFYKLKNLFDVVTISAQYKSGKSEKLVFEKTLSALDLKPEECIFIDNNPNFLIAPQAIGIPTILFDDENRDFKAFKTTLFSML